MKPDPPMNDAELRAWDLYAAMYKHDFPNTLAETVEAANWADAMIYERRKRAMRAAPPRR